MQTLRISNRLEESFLLWIDAFLGLAFDNMINAAEENQIGNIVDAKLVKNPGFISRNGFVTDVK